MIQKKEAESAAEKTKASTEGKLPEGVENGSGADPSVPITGQPTPVRTKDLMTQIVSKENMSLAYKRVDSVLNSKYFLILFYSRRLYVSLIRAVHFRNGCSNYFVSLLPLFVR